jgi:phytoene dehydrogenase-like protein
MNKVDIAIVGSGIGGAMIASLNKNRDLILFEKDRNLGGCASTFKRGKSYYNSGATTFVGYEKDHIIKDIFDKSSTTPNIQKSKIAIRVIQNNKIVDRVKDFDEFVDNINRVYPHKNNMEFWTKIRDIDRKFWQIKDIYYAKHSLKNYIKSAIFAKKLLSVYGFDIIMSANNFIDKYLPNISDEYREFIDAQLLITVQARADNVTLLSLALGLSYPFHDVYYAIGGMGSIIEELLKDINISKKDKVTNIIKEQNKYRVISTKGEYIANNVILNSSIYQSNNIFEQKDIKEYYNSFEFSDQSAFVIYLTIKPTKEYLHHYQIIHDKVLSYGISNSYFVSFSDKDDIKMSKNGLSVTISTHTKASTWICDQDEYEKRKEILKNEILKSFVLHLDIDSDSIIQIDAATAYTFNRYIDRYNCGGKAINLSTILQLPSQNTPFSGLYNIGDTTFAGQGWPGVAIGVSMLNRLINE